MVDLLTLVLALVAVAFGLAVGFYAGRLVTQRTLELDFREREREARRDSVERSRSTLSGQVLEKLAPHFPDFPYDPTDLRFIGTPVDYLVFDGLGEGDVQEIIFLEVKSGRSGLTTRERRVRDAVEAGAVRWDVYRIPDKD